MESYVYGRLWAVQCDLEAAVARLEEMRRRAEQPSLMADEIDRVMFGVGQSARVVGALVDAERSERAEMAQEYAE